MVWFKIEHACSEHWPSALNVIPKGPDQTSVWAESETGLCVTVSQDSFEEMVEFDGNETELHHPQRKLWGLHNWAAFIPVCEAQSYIRLTLIKCLISKWCICTFTLLSTVPPLINICHHSDRPAMVSGSLWFSVINYDYNTVRNTPPVEFSTHSNCFSTKPLILIKTPPSWRTV